MGLREAPMGPAGFSSAMPTGQPRGADFLSADSRQLTCAGGERKVPFLNNQMTIMTTARCAAGLKGHLNSVLGGPHNSRQRMRSDNPGRKVIWEIIRERTYFGNHLGIIWECKQ
jgi:hypothetical protein